MIVVHGFNANSLEARLEQLNEEEECIGIIVVKDPSLDGWTKRYYTLLVFRDMGEYFRDEHFHSET